MKTTMKRISAAAAKAAVALAFALFAATTAQAAASWTGNSTGDIRDSANYQSNNKTWSLYINSDNLTGNKRTSLWIKQNTTTFKLGDSKAVYKAMQFQKGNNWEFHSNVEGNPNAVFSFDNSAGSDSSNDKDRICVAAQWTGAATSGDAALRVYAIDLKTKYLYVGSSSYGTTGTLTINKNSSYDSKYVTKFTTTDKMYLYKGSMTIADSTVTSGGNMELHNFTVNVNSGTLNANADIIIGQNAGTSATFTQNGGTVTVANNKWTKAYKGNGTLNLNGGTFTTQHVTDEGAGSSLTVNFNGGTLKANAAHSSGLLCHRSGNGLTVNVGENGGTIDTGAFNIKVAVPINAVENTAGSFTVKGGGSATFTSVVNLGGGLTVTGGTAATFGAMGEVAGALTVGDSTTLHWFDQDGAVSATPGFTSLALGAGSTIYLDGDATAVDALPATVTTTATTENKANVAINFSALPAPGATFALLPAASADVFAVSPSYAGISLPCEVAVVDGNLVLTIVAEDYTWNGTGTNWGDADAWTKGGAAATWADGNNAIFNTASATATLAANASPAKIEFTADATVDGAATLTAPSVSVAPSVSATISANTAGTLEKTGAGTLALGASRTAQTTVTEGTLVMADGATVDGTKLTLGTDAAKAVTFDYGGQTLTANPATYVGGGMNVTLANGSYEYSNTYALDADSGNFPSVLTVGPGATVQATAFNWNTRGGSGTINVVGGAVKSTAGGSNHWIMQKSLTGSLDINVTDGGLLEFGGETYMLSCRDAVGGSTAYESPKMNVKVVDSTVCVKNGKSIRLGLDDSMKPSATPEFTLGATNSVFDIGYGFYIGNNPAEGRATEGFYKTDFENCVITAKQFRVYNGRPLNSARLNNSQIVFNVKDSEIYATDGSNMDGDAKWITVDVGGLTIDNQTFNGDLKANLGGPGAVTKKGTGILHIKCDQTNEISTAAFICAEGETYLLAGHSMARAVTVKSGAKFTVNGSNTTAVASIALEGGAELRFDKFRERQAPLLVGALTLPAEGTATITFGGTPAEGKACELLTITNAQTLAAADLAKLALPAGYENYSLGLSADGKTLYIVGGSSLVWTGAGADTAWTTDGNWLGGAAPDGTVDPSFLEGLISGSRTVTFDDASIAKYVWVDGGTAANPVVFEKADGGAGRLAINNNSLIVGQKSSEAALTIARGMHVDAKLVRVGGLASSVSRLTVQGSLHTTSHVCVGSNGAEGEVTGIIDIDGGAVTNDTDDLVVGDFAGPSSANYTVFIRNGGEYNSLPSNGIRVSAGADGTIAITNGTLRAESGNVNLSDSQAGRGTLILGPGALVVTKRVTSKDSTSTGHKVVFDGGTLKAVADDEYFIDPRNNNGVARVEVEVGTGGGTIDTAGKNVAFCTPAGGAGGLAVTGGGELTFNNKNGNRTASAFDYEGATTVAAGTAIRSGAAVTTFAGDLSLAAGAKVNVGLVSGQASCLAADDISIASGAKIVLDAAAFPAGTYPVLRKTGGGAFTAGDLANLTLDASILDGLSTFTRLVLGGTDNDSICLVVDHAIVPVMGRVASDGEPVTLTGNDVLVGAGGLDIGTLKIPDNGRLVFDPVKTPVYVYSQNSGKYLTFGSGAKLALTPNYAGMTLGRIVLLGYKPGYVDGLPENLNDIFDASTIAPGATYTITSEPIPEKETYASYLVLTVGDYENDAKEIRLTCIGDSITQGTGSDPSAQYRTRIAARLAANGYKPKMLGIWKKNYKEATGLAQPEDWRWHSGISGDMIMTHGTRGGLRDNLHVYLDAAGNADVITLLIGVNDIRSGGKTAEETYAAYTNVIFDIARLRPATKIIGSTILDCDGDGGTAQTNVAAFNALLKADYAAGRLPANYTMLDLFEAVPLTTGETGNFFDDLLHPNWVGCSAIAEDFAAGIMNALPFATYAGPIETEATDEPEAALGAAGIAATVEGAGLAAYTNGMSHIFTIEKTTANNSLYGSSPYTEIVTPAGLDRNVKKAGYFMELVRKGTSHHRYVWVDFDATGKTLDEIDFPWNGANLDFVAEKLHVFSNDGSIHNVAADDDTVTGAIEGTYWNYSGGDDNEIVPSDIESGKYGWNDTLGSSGGYGGFQAHRIFGEDEHWHGGEVLFAWNAWGSSNTSNNDELGIGSFFYSKALGGNGDSMDYTFTKGASDGAADKLTAAGYQVVRLEIWAELEGLPRHGYWSGASGDFSDPKNWEDGVVPSAGDDLNFSLLTAEATVNGNVDAKFGAVTMGSQRVVFTNAYMRAESFSDMLKVEVGANSTVTIDGDLMFDGDNNYAVYKVNAGGKFIVTGKLGLSEGSAGNLNAQNSVGDGHVVAGEIANNTQNKTIYTDINLTRQNWVVGPGGMTSASGRGWWGLSDSKNSAYFYPYTNDFTVAAPTCIRESFGHYELNTTGFGDGLGHTITLDAGYSDNGKLYIAGTGKVVVNHTPAAYDGKGAYSGNVTVSDTATLAINAGKKLTTGKVTFAAGTTLEVPSTGVDMGAIAFSGSGTVALKIADASLADGEYTLITSTSDLPADVLARFEVSANTASDICLIMRDARTLRLAVRSSASASPLHVWTGKAGDGNAETTGNWLAGAKPADGAEVFIPATSGTIDFAGENLLLSSITFGYGSGAVTLNGENAITGVAAITNLSTTASHTINVPVHFTGDIQVKQDAMAEVGDLTKAHITFAGGAYAAPGYAIENGSSSAVYSRCMFGKYYLANAANNLWSATVQGSSKRLCVADNSTLYIPYAGVLTELYIGYGAKADVGSIAASGGRIGYKNFGEMVVTNMTITGSGDRYVSYQQGTATPGVFKFESVTNSMTGNWFYLSDANAAASHVFYIGKGGLNFANASGSAAYDIGLNKDGNSETIRPWYSDFTIAGRGDSTTALVLRRNVEFCTDDESGIGRTITIDGVTRAITTPAITVSGSGTLCVNKAANNEAQPTVTVTDTATLAIKPGASLGTGAMTFNNGTTLALPQTGTVTMGGDLTLAAGTTIAYTLGKTDTTLDVTGMTLTLPGEGTVEIAFASGSVYAPGKTYTLISGANLKDADLAKFTFPESESEKFSIEGGNLVYVAPSYFTIRIADAGGDAGRDFDVTVPGAWLTVDAGLETCGEGTLASLGANGLPLWKSYCLGLRPTDATSLVLCEPALAQAPSGSEFAVCAKNLSVPDGLEGVAVTAYLQRKTANGDWVPVGDGVSVVPGAGPVVLAGTLGEGESVSFFA